MSVSFLALLSKAFILEDSDSRQLSVKKLIAVVVCHGCLEITEKRLTRLLCDKEQ